MFRQTILCCITLLAALSANAGEWGHWNTKSPATSNRWVDYDEARPDLVPDAWLIAKLANAEGDEIMLRSSNDAMLRWVHTEQIRYLQAVHQKIEKVAELEVDLYLTRGDSPNASAGKRNGRNTVLVNFAMLDMVQTNVDEWAALMGHEIAHLKLLHIDEHRKRNVPLAVLKTLSNAVLAADPLANAASGLLIDGIGLKFSRDAERESDYMGVIWAIEAGYDPMGAASLHSKMAEMSRAHPLPFLNSHPSSPERIETLRALAERLGN